MAHIVNLTKRSLENILAVGDVVTLQNSAELMTVESVRTGTFGVVLECVWFDRDDALCYNRHPFNKMHVFPRTTPHLKAEPGVEVRLRSRGPVMTVRDVQMREGIEYANCAWTGPTGRERRRLFPVDALVWTMMERFEGLHGESI
jgi:uncharacterized protein YodC (DUF2158 family)